MRMPSDAFGLRDLGCCVFQFSDDAEVEGAIEQG
jgi:hypothetical protein